MQILIYADGCPVTKIAARTAAEWLQDVKRSFRVINENDKYTEE